MDLFAYGTLRVGGVWRLVVGSPPPPRIGGVARGYAAYRVRGQVYPAITPRADAATPGDIYLNVPAGVVARIDSFEGGAYQRREIAVACAGDAPRRCLAYVFPEHDPQVLTRERWAYREFVASGGLARFLERMD